MEMCYIHMFIHTEFEIINVFKRKTFIIQAGVRSHTGGASLGVNNSLIKRINIYINVYSLNQNIVSFICFI